MHSIKNIMPRQIEYIPWGWVNEEVNGSQWVVKPRGEIVMPRLVDYFDFDNFEYSEIPELQIDRDCVCSVNMKSVFTTAVRFLGYEEAMIRLLLHVLDLSAIFDSMFEWNVALVWRAPVKIGRMILGDEIGTSRGMMISPELYRSDILPFHRRFADYANLQDIDIWYHSDGDISDVLPDIMEAGFKGVYYEAIGSMEKTIADIGFQGIEVIR